jgi:hypothetical protein
VTNTRDVDFLYLYGADMSLLTQSPRRHDADLVVGVEGGVKRLKAVFDKFLSERKTFRRVMFETHGNTGAIVFGNEKGNRQIDADVLSRKFDGYDALFPESARLTFSGCKVADDDDGWVFLETAAKVLLKRSGMTSGWTSVGFAVGGNLSAIPGGAIYDRIVGGQVWHPWGDKRSVWAGPGGSPILHSTDWRSGVAGRSA